MTESLNFSWRPEGWEGRSVRFSSSTPFKMSLSTHTAFNGPFGPIHPLLIWGTHPKTYENWIDISIARPVIFNYKMEIDQQYGQVAASTLRQQDLKQQEIQQKIQNSTAKSWTATNQHWESSCSLRWYILYRCSDWRSWCRYLIILLSLSTPFKCVNLKLRFRFCCVF